MKTQAQSFLEKKVEVLGRRGKDGFCESDLMSLLKNKVTGSFPKYGSDGSGDRFRQLHHIKTYYAAFPHHGPDEGSCDPSMIVEFEDGSKIHVGNPSQVVFPINFTVL